MEPLDAPGTTHRPPRLRPRPRRFCPTDGNRPRRFQLVEAKSMPLGTFVKLERTQKVNELPVCYYCIMLVAPRNTNRLLLILVSRPRDFSLDVCLRESRFGRESGSPGTSLRGSPPGSRLFVLGTRFFPNFFPVLLFVRHRRAKLFRLIRRENNNSWALLRPVKKKINK
jgi:hypothetical protein